MWYNQRGVERMLRQLDIEESPEEVITGGECHLLRRAAANTELPLLLVVEFTAGCASVGDPLFLAMVMEG